jgi:uncharacterized damage-inducible protein DinB
MPMSNPLDILLAHDRWATRQIIQACAALPAEKFHQKFEMRPGSLHATIAHLLGSMQEWTDMLAQREQRPPLDAGGVSYSPDQLRTALDELVAERDNLARAHPLDEMVSRERGGKVYSFTRGAVLTHVTTHAMHHRAECLDMLRHLGVNPLPPSSVLEWMLTVDVAK